jgi:hypothetical protein
MTLADELTELAAKVEGCKTMAGRTAGIERSKLLGEALSYRLAILYKVEDHWGEVIESLRCSSTTQERK